MAISAKHALSALVLPCVLVGVGGCGETATTNNFSGPSKAVAQRISALQQHATEASEKKICSEDLSASLVRKLQAGGGCTGALKLQLKAVEEITLGTKTISVSGSSAQAQVQSTYSGKLCDSTLLLNDEAGTWKISGLRSDCR